MYELMGEIRDSAGASKRERNMFAWRQTFAAQALRLTSDHFAMMSLDSMKLALDVAAAVGPASGCAHVTSGVSAHLLARLAEADVVRATDVVIQLMRVRGDTLDAMTMTLILNQLLQRLTTHFSDAATGNASSSTPADGAAASAVGAAASADPSSSPSSPSSLVRHDDAAFRRKVILQLVSRCYDRRCGPYFNERLLSGLVIQLLQDSTYLVAAAAAAPALPPSPARPYRASAIVAVIATTVCRLRIFGPSIVDFFKWGAPICIDEVELLSGSEIGYVLEAYSVVGYHHVGLFITLAQKAGELGELLRAEEVARVLNAMSRTTIDHSKLRRSLESSMRMKNITRRTSYSTTA